MLYGNIYYPRGGTMNGGKSGKINIGDSFQWLAIQYIYHKMGIEEKDIIQIPKAEVGTYEGENVILPINCLYSGNGKGIRLFPLSRKILPVFLGLSLVNCPLDETDIHYLKEYQPIGCRDEDTVKKLRKYGVDAYLNGCVTTVFPFRDVNKENKVFAIDVDKRIIEKIEQNVDKSIVNVSHIVNNNTIDNMGDFIRNVYTMYKEEAGLVVTSRLHAAVPCWAAGIPTIIVRNRWPATFSWIEKVIPSYLLDEYENINWKPKILNSEEIKRQILNVAIDRLKLENVEKKRIEKIDTFWNSRKKREYYTLIDDVINYIKSHWDKKQKVKYCFWGATIMAKEIYRYISANYPNAVLQATFDKYREVELCGTKTMGLENLKRYKNCYLFVTGYRASIEGREVLTKLGWGEKRYYLLYDPANL